MRTIFLFIVAISLIFGSTQAFAQELPEGKNVKEWERHNKERVKDLKYKIRRMAKSKEQTTLIRELQNREVFLANIARYLDTGVWLDLFYGKDQDHKTRWRTLAYAYDNEGYVKV